MSPGAGMESTEALVKSAVAGDTVSYGELVRRFERSVVTTGWSILGDFHLAQDVAQEVFTIAHGQLVTLRDGSSFGSWVLKIARNRALRRRKQEATHRSAVPFMDGFGAVRDAALDEYREELIRAVGQLPEQERIVVVLRYFDGQPVDSIAQLTGRPIGTVTKQLSRAVERLRYLTRKVRS